MLRHFSKINSLCSFNLFAIACVMALAHSHVAQATQAGDPGTVILPAEGHGAGAAQRGAAATTAQGVRAAQEDLRPYLISKEHFIDDKKITVPTAKGFLTPQEAKAAAKQNCEKLVSPTATRAAIDMERGKKRLPALFNNARRDNRATLSTEEFPANITSLSDFNQKLSVNCSTVRFRAFYGVRFGSPSFGENAIAATDDISRDYAVEQMKNQKIPFFKEGKYKGIVHVQPECTPRSRAEITKIREVQTCFEQADRDFKDPNPLKGNKQFNKDGTPNEEYLKEYAQIQGAHLQVAECQNKAKELADSGIKQVNVQYEPTACEFVELN